MKMKNKMLGLLLVVIMTLSIAFTCMAESELPTSGTPSPDLITGSGLFNVTSEISSRSAMEPRAEYGIINTDLGISYSPSLNKISYDFYTRSTHTASEIGMSYLALQIWNSSTSQWDTVVSGSDYDYNKISHSAAFVHSSVVKGAYYRVIGYHYAKINSTGYTLYNETEYILAQ